MNYVLIDEKPFNKEDFTTGPLAKGEYENCPLSHCDFSHSTLAGGTIPPDFRLGVAGLSDRYNTVIDTLR